MKRFVLAIWLYALTNFTIHGQTDKLVLTASVLTESEVQAGTTVVYLIRFQNIGLDTVKNVIIRDTLDARFEQGTFEMVASSHDYELVRDGGDVVRWIFPQIGLSDSASNIGNSHGFVLFKARPKKTLTAGQVLFNKAHIYFDDLPPQITNTAVVSIESGTGVSPEAGTGNWRIFPNPNRGSFQIARSSGVGTRQPELLVIDNAGQSVPFRLLGNRWDEAVALELAESQTGLFKVVIIENGQVLTLPVLVCPGQ